MFRPDDIQAWVRERPFKPLRLVLSTGQTYDISHPDLIMIGSRDVMVGLPSVNNPGVYQRVSRIAIMHIAEMQDLPLPTESGGNGPAPQ
jgi:hypothetical protein